MRTFKEAMTAKRNLKELEEFLIHLESNGLSSMKFVEWLSTNGLKQLNEGRGAPNQPGLIPGAFQNVLGKPLGYLATKVGQGIGGAAGIVADTAKGIGSVAGSITGGLAGGAGTGYQGVTQGGTLQAYVNSAQTALQNLEKRMQSSPPLRELLGKPEFKQLLQNLKNTIANDLIETYELNNNLFQDFRQELEYRKIFLELSNNGINPAKVFEFYIENGFHLNDINLNEIFNWIRGAYQRINKWLQGNQGKYDKDAIEKAVKAVQELQKSFPQFNENPTDNFKKISQELIDVLNQSIGQKASNEADNKASEKLKQDLKALVDPAKQQNIDNIDPAFFTNKILNNYNNFIKNITEPNIQKDWIKTVAEKIADNPNTQEIEKTINGFQSIEYFIQGLLKGGTDATKMEGAATKLRGMDKKLSYYLSSNLLKHITTYAKIVKNDSVQLKKWYDYIGDLINSDKNYSEILQKAEDIENQEVPAKISTLFAALTNATDKEKYGKVPQDKKRAFEERFDQIYDVTGYDPKSGKLILDLAISKFDPNSDDIVKAIQEAFQKALSEKLSEFYIAARGKDDINITSLSYEDQVKLIQKFNEFLKTTPSDEDIKNFWVGIGYKKRKGEDIFAESRRLKKNNAFLESVLGRTRNPQAGWFNY